MSRAHRNPALSKFTLPEVRGERSPQRLLLCYLHLFLWGLAEGELEDLIEEFSDGKVQFAFVKVKDLNSGLPKFVLICWVWALHPPPVPVRLTERGGSAARVFRKELRVTSPAI